MVTEISRGDGASIEYQYDALNHLVRETKKEKKDEGRGKKGQRDRDFGIKDKGFWKWWEKIKPKVKGQDLTASDVWIWYEQYKNEKGK